ncbi:MAG: 30S ribosomal protein S20 [Phycisphaeraceae bacterium]|nr:30S ribosomal protein S20 [Phycisphaeraceae bacterium]MCW5753737.1 30S ribosomal protein S20 [Phycisphaeraceae bacterium]
MAHSSSARKRIRQNAKRRARNRWRLRTLRQAIRDFHTKLAHGTVAEATDAYASCQKIIDRSAQKGVIHPNQRDRRKSRLVAALKRKKAAA